LDFAQPRSGQTNETPEIPVHFLPLALPTANSISNMNINTKINDWIKCDPIRWLSIRVLAAPLKRLVSGGDRCNLVWDKLHHYPATPSSDIITVHFDPSDISPERDAFWGVITLTISTELVSQKSARCTGIMSHPYLNTLAAMSYWVEIETAVGVQLSVTGELLILAPFGLNRLILTITLNDKRPKPADFYARITEKRWLDMAAVKAINNSFAVIC
jgi:hypothetical protein